MPQPTKPAGLRSPTILGMQAAGWVVLACLWLPINRGCNGSITRPVENLRLNPPIQMADIVLLGWMIGCYGNGLMAAMLLALSVIWCGETLWWRAFIAQLTCAGGLCLMTLALNLNPSNHAKELTQNLLVLVPPMILSWSWIGLAMRYRQRQSAWARLQHSWTLVGLVMLQLQSLFSTKILYGYWVSIVGFVGLTFSIELARLRMKHDLWDRSAPALRPQFTIRGIFFWTTFCALVVGYYGAIGPILSWMFPEQ